MALNYPLIAWGSAEDIAAGASWSSGGTPIVTGGQADPFGGTGATRIEDDSAAVAEYREQILGAWPKSTIEVDWFLKDDTAVQSDYFMRDVTAAVNVGILRHTWTAGVPTVALVGGTTGTTFGPISVGAGWWYGKAILTGLTPGNVLSRRLLGGISTSSSVGATIWYLRNAVLLDVPQNYKAWRAPRSGSEKVNGLDGGFDTWLTGKDYRCRGDVPWIPSAPRSSPALVSGWEGLNPAIAVEVGVQAMLEAGWNAQSLLFVPDRSLCSFSIASELVKPFMEEEPDTKPNGDRALVPLELKSPGTVPYPMPI